MQYNIQLTIGHNVDGVETHTTEDITKAIYKALEIEAFTAIPCRGMWRGECELSTRIEINRLTENEAARITERIPILAAQLKQDAIMFEKFESNTQFITATADEMEVRA